MIELCLNLTESRELDFELPADVAELLFNSREHDGSGWRWSSGAAVAALALLSSLPLLAALAPFPALAPFAGVALFAALTTFSAPAVRPLRAASADRL